MATASTRATRARLRLYPGINLRIVAPFLLIVAMVAALGIFITTRLVVGSIQERFANQLADSTRAATNGFVDLENQLLATLRLMVFTEGVADALTAQNVPAMETLLRPLAGNSIFDQVIVFDLSGTAVLQLNRIPASEGADANDLPSWAIVQDILSGRADGQGDKFTAMIDTTPNVMLFMTAPITDLSDRIVGGIAGGITGGTLLSRLSQQSLSALILYSPTGAVWDSTLGRQNAALNLSSDHFDQLYQAVQDVSPLEDLQVADRSYQVLFAPFDLRQEQKGLIAVALPSNFIVERSSTTRDTFLALFAGLFVSVIMVGIAVAQTITRPVARLVETTRAIRRGDLSRRVLLNIPDELGELGISLDQMTEQLVQRNIEVNQLYREQVQETARLDAIISSISDALFVVDTSGTIVLRNRNASALLDSLTGDRSLRNRFSSLFKQIEDFNIARTVELGAYTYRIQTTHVADETGAVIGYVMTFQDITALIQTERIKDDLVRQMSHELRTPLTAIRGYVELTQIFERERLSPKGHEFISNSLEGLSVMERMVNEVIEVSVIISNRFELNRTVFDLVAVLKRLVSEWEPICAGRELTLTMQAPDRLAIEADDERLMQVLEHVIRNAYSYSLPGSQIDLQAYRDRDRIVITVADQGVGIPEDELDRVFERMYRGSSADAGPTDARGLGLGLYISKTIVEAHQGAIQLTSLVDQGTTVTIWLPVGQVMTGQSRLEA